MIRALRFQPGRPAETIPPARLPAAPGSGIWCDLGRGDVPDAPAPTAPEGAATPTTGPAQGGAPAAAGVARWLQALHPLTAGHLRDPSPHLLAVAQEHYVHVRLRLPECVAAGGCGSHAADLDVVMGQGFALTTHTVAPDAWDELWEGYTAGRYRADGVDFAIYQALVRATKGYRETSSELLAATERVVERLTDKRARHVLVEIVHLRRRSAASRNVLAGAVDALGVLSAGARAQALRPSVQPFYQDLREQTAHLLDAVEEARGTLAEGVEGYTSVQSTEMNRVMQIFTVVAVLFMPPTLIASIYGMNFMIPEYHWNWGYAWALGLMVVTTAVLTAWLRGRNFL